MYQVSESTPALAKGFWLAVGAAAVLGAAGAALLSWLLSGSPAEALMGTLVSLPTVAIQLYTIHKRRDRVPTEAQLRRAPLIYAGSVVATVVYIVVWALLDSAPGLQINVRTSLFLGVLLTMLCPGLVGAWLVHRTHRRRASALPTPR